VPHGRILIVQGEANESDVLRLSPKSLRLQVATATGAEAAIKKLEQERFHAIISSLGMADGKAKEILRYLKGRGIETPVIIIADRGDFSVAEEYHAAGAFDFMVLPMDHYVLTSVIRRALLRSGLMFPDDVLPKTPGSRPVRQFSFLVGTSKPMMEVLCRIAKVAEADTNVCICGETGTGKELVARAIHYSSRRADHPLIVFDCTAVAEGLMEAELFGHVKGSFTSAVADRKGLFELADGGSLFFDEVGELNLQLQAKLLRVIQCREFRKVGGKDSIAVDVRIIAATNRNLPDMVAKKTFREDLFYRLDVISIALPPLRERKEDIPVLVDHIIQRFNRQNEKQVRAVSPKSLGTLLCYHWPGNVRELENCIERAAIMSDDNTLDIENISQFLRSARSAERSPLPTGGDSSPRSLKEAERDLILETLRGAGGDRVEAARLLGISLRTLYYKLKGIEGVEIPPTRKNGSNRRKSSE
jgi:DNA-binding NtrC family response regulator